MGTGWQRPQFDGLLVESLVAKSIAAECDKIMVGDRIIEVNGTATKGMGKAEALQLLKLAGTRVELKLKSGRRDSDGAPAAGAEVAAGGDAPPAPAAGAEAAKGTPPGRRCAGATQFKWRDAISCKDVESFDPRDELVCTVLNAGLWHCLHANRLREVRRTPRVARPAVRP